MLLLRAAACATPMITFVAIATLPLSPFSLLAMMPRARGYTLADAVDMPLISLMRIHFAALRTAQHHAATYAAMLLSLFLR